jgi:hypothetical protein
LGVTVTSPDDVGAWLLKCSPERWDLVKFIRDGHRTIDSWTITVTDARLAVGQPVLFWVTGRAGTVPEPGLWGAGVVMGGYRVGDAVEDGYWHDSASKPKSWAWIPVDIMLFDSPIPRTALEDDLRLRDFRILRTPVAGNPQQVTPRQLAVIERYLGPGETVSFGPSARARAIVADEYRRMGWQVTRAHDTDAGWDLACHDGTRTRRFAVRPASQIVVGRAEIRAATDPCWRLVVVNGSTVTECDGNAALDHAEAASYTIPAP